MTTDRPSPQQPHDDSYGDGAFVFDTASVPAVAVPLDPLTAAVARALAQPPPPTWLHSAVLLGITLLLFSAAGFFRNTLTELALVVAILLFHESGHYLGMRLFNYQDVRMFFIPFFGAAVSGRSTSVEGYKEAIVLLLGPQRRLPRRRWYGWLPDTKRARAAFALGGQISVALSGLSIARGNP